MLQQRGILVRIMPALLELAKFTNMNRETPLIQTPNQILLVIHLDMNTMQLILTFKLYPTRILRYSMRTTRLQSTRRIIQVPGNPLRRMMQIQRNTVVCLTTYDLNFLLHKAFKLLLTSLKAESQSHRSVLTFQIVSVTRV